MFYTDTFVSKQNLFWFMKVGCGRLHYEYENSLPSYLLKQTRKRKSCLSTMNIHVSCIRNIHV